MTVKELIEELKKYDGRLEVKVDSYGEMTRSNIQKVEEEITTLIKNNKVILNVD